MNAVPTIPQIIMFRVVKKIPNERFAKCAMGKELAQWLKETIVIAPENLGNSHGCPFNGIPYEVEQKMSNASDCDELMQNL
jgi:hypothetical protein